MCLCQNNGDYEICNILSGARKPQNYQYKQLNMARKIYSIVRMLMLDNNDTDLITVQHQFELIFNCFISNMPIYGNIMISKTLESCKYLVVHSFQFLQHSSALCP